jgi:peptidoglycan/xylan/chitin deacetylase (PgdA/CDA1 family)
VIRWPNDARIAVWFCPNVLFFEYEPLPSPVRDTFYLRGTPDVRVYAHQDYANRIGFWRTLELVDDLHIKCTPIISVAVLDHYPEIRDAMVKRNWDYMVHSIYNTCYLWNVSVDEERAYYQDIIETGLRHTGKRIKGAMGPGPRSSTVNSPDLVAEAGFLYSADLSMDDQPFPVRVKTGRLITMPYGSDINSAGILGTAAGSAFEVDDFAEMIRRQFDQLYAEGAESGTIMCVALHTYLTAQPHRARYIREAMEYVLGHSGVWQATAGDIAEYYPEHCYDQVVATLDWPTSTGQS